MEGHVHLDLARLRQHFGIGRNLARTPCASRRRDPWERRAGTHRAAQTPRLRTRSATAAAVRRSWRNRRSTARWRSPAPASPRRGTGYAASPPDQMLIVVELGVGHADALDFAALDGERRVGDALVALDHAEFRAEHVIEHARKDAERRAGAAAGDDKLVREQIVGCLHRRGVPIHAYPARQRIGAEPDEAARVGFDIGLSHHRLAGEIARERADHGAVARRHVGDEIGGDDARRLRHVLHDDGGLSGNVPLQMFGEKARADVVVAADRMPADQTDLLALVEILHALPAGPRRHARNQAECRQPVTRFRIHVVFPIVMPRIAAA